MPHSRSFRFFNFSWQSEAFFDHLGHFRLSDAFLPKWRFFGQVTLFWSSKKWHSWRIDALMKWRFGEVTRIHILLLSIEQGISTRSCIFAIDLNARKVYTTRCHVNWFKKYLEVWKNKIRLNKSLGLKLRSKNFILYPLMRSFFILEIFFTIRFLESWLNLVQAVLGGGLRVCFWPLGVALSTWRNSRTGLSITPHPNLNW